MMNPTRPVSVICPSCVQTIEVPLGCVALMVCTNRPALSYYTFRCPRCSVDARRDAHDYARNALEEAGLKPTHWTVPAEILEPHTGAAITHDEILDAHLALEAADCLAPLAAALIGA